MCRCWLAIYFYCDFFKTFWGGFGGGISIGKQLNFHDVSFDNVGGAFVSFDTFIVQDRIFPSLSFIMQAPSQIPTFVIISF